MGGDGGLLMKNGWGWWTADSLHSTYPPSPTFPTDCYFSSVVPFCMKIKEISF
jgi:hypothetical protein